MCAAEPDALPPETADERSERHLRILAELEEIGMDMARAVRKRALESEDQANIAECGLVFARLSRAVRQTVGLENKLALDRDKRANQKPTPNPMHDLCVSQARLVRRRE